MLINMKKLHVVMLSLVALFAFSAVVANASAETTLLAEWLIAGTPVATLTVTEGTGKVILEDAKIKSSMECEGISDGSVGANGEGEVIEVLVGGAVASLAKPVVCKGIGGCGAPAEAAPENLPWHGLLFLTEGGLFRGAGFSGSYWSMCNILGVLVEEECTVTNGTGEVLNVTAGVEGMGEVTPLGSCTTGGNSASAQSAVAGNTLLTAGGVLSASE
jgi:hypothetical protein